MALLLSTCGLFWGAHKSLAPRARTLLGGLGQATLSFSAVATLLFVFFGECPKFCDLAKQRRKIVGGVSEVGRDHFSLYFFWRCVIFLVFSFSSAAIARHTRLYILRRRPLVQELISRVADIGAHIDDVSLGTITQEDHVLLLCEFFAVCQENHLRVKLEKCEFMKVEMEYLCSDVGYGWWKPAASKIQPLQGMQIRDDPKKGLHEVRSFVGACNFYRRHIHNFTYSPAPLTDQIKKPTPGGGMPERRSVSRS